MYIHKNKLSAPQANKPVQKNKLSHKMRLRGFNQLYSEYYHVPYPSLTFLLLPPVMFLEVVMQMITNHQLPLQLHRNTFRQKSFLFGCPACLKAWPMFAYFFFKNQQKKVERTNLQIHIFGNRPSVRLAISIYSYIL